MKIAILCANGKAGQLITKEAIERNLDVTAIVRGENKSVADKVITKDLFNLTKEDLTQFDVVINAFGAWTAETIPLTETSLSHLCNILEGTETRLLIIGGAGSLYVNQEHTIKLMDTPDFPEMFMPLAVAADKALTNLRKVNNVNWTYVSPVADFDAEGVRQGTYTLGGEELVLNANGESYISYADYAVAMVDLALSNKFNRERITVVSK